MFHPERCEIGAHAEVVRNLFEFQLGAFVTGQMILKSGSRSAAAAQPPISASCDEFCPVGANRAGRDFGESDLSKDGDWTEHPIPNPKNESLSPKLKRFPREARFAASFANLSRNTKVISMSNIGKLAYQGEHRSLDDIRGHIRTLKFQAEIRIRKVEFPPASPDAPTHKVTAKGPTGEFLDVGRGWEKSITRGPNEGDTFLSVTIDDPSFEHSLNFAVFKDDDHAAATWRRRQDQTV